MVKRNSDKRNLIVKVDNLTYRYPETDFDALKDINLEIEEGDFALLVGPSGSGKSTLLQTLNGIIPKLKGGKLTGSIEINNMNVKEYEIAEMAEHIGMVFQDSESQLTSVFIKDEIAFGPENFKLDREEIFKRIDSALDYVGLDMSGDRYVYEMSGGQQQRLAIGSVLAMDAKFLTLDDPTANLDPVGSDEVLSVLKQMRKEGRTVLVTTHCVDEFILLATKLIVMNGEGKIIASGKPRDVLGRYGKEMRDEIGVWLPQLVGIDLELREKTHTYNDLTPISIKDSTKKYKSLQFNSDNFKSRKSRIVESGENILDAKNLCYMYPDGTHALFDMSFEVKEGLMTGILGPNGAGKSTLASLMVGLKKLTSGELFFKGKNLGDLRIDDVARRVGFVFQNPEHQFIRDTVKEEIAYSLAVLGKPKGEIDTKVKEMLNLLKLEHLEDRHPFGLSGGEKRRLSVAVMLVAQPELLILDEPTYGQDCMQVHNIMDLVEDQLSEGVTVLMITHDMRLVEEYCDKVLILDSGELLYSGLPENMFDDPKIIQDVTLKPTPLQTLIQKLRKDGKDIHHDTRTIDQLVRQVV